MQAHSVTFERLPGSPGMSFYTKKPMRAFIAIGFARPDSPPLFFRKGSLMFNVLRNWMQRYFSDEEAVVLAVLLVLAFTLVLTLGGMLAPVLAGLVLAFLMHGLVSLLERLRMPEMAAVGLVFTLFVGVLLVFLLVLVPLLWHQMITLFNELPGMFAKWQSVLLLLPERYPHLVSDEQVLLAIEVARGEVGKVGQLALTFSLSSLPVLVNLMIYLVLVPILVFFFLKDRHMIGRWARGYLPRERALLNRVADEMKRQIANYIRGKVIEIFICGGVTYIAFVALGLNYAALLAMLVGISVVVPYVGAVVVTVPVALIGLFQWGWGDQFIYLMIAHGIIQALDGNVLVPLLFSEAVNLHPVAIICAVLLFGGLWGFWGIFFAIPLATLFKAVLDAWPRNEPPVAPLL
ncbi:Permease [Pseudomonas syringae pv. coriandricola]|uniref:Permease n=2 Tax=Pseudomonas syringae group TaxID=136849 RepID=A0A0P9L4M2_9PSED|nr:Permease [Pseudomonas syringae pv. coriandricola]RMN06944.1 Permease [Pseudomonas syringae pv. coriandricola]